MQRIIVVLFLLVLISMAFVAGRCCRQERRDLPGGPARNAEAVSGTAARVDRSVKTGLQAETQPTLLGVNQPQAAFTNEAEMLDDLHVLLAAGDVEGALDRARQLMKSRAAGVRLAAVRVFGQVGLKALPELADLIYDGDATVSREAFLHWKGLVAKIPDEGKQRRLFSEALSVVGDKSKINELAAVLAELPRPSAVRGLSSVIQNAPPVAAEAAAAQYQRLTAERYTTPQAAETWIKAHGAADNAAQNKR